MELAQSCAFVFMIASSQLVAAVPHGYGGYGVKGGAAAKAQAGATAGAFAGAGVLPFAFPPNGAGFAGSYSKSSSSSFASSSASSSSSSFSFSGSGVQGGGGCTTGVCPNAETNGNHVPNGNVDSYNSNNAANAAAAAHAGALAGSLYPSKDIPCSGNNCNQKETDCKGPNCNDFSSPANKCEAGQCSGNPTVPSAGSLDNFNGPKDEAGAASNTRFTNSATGTSNLNLENIHDNKCTSGNCGRPALPSLDYNPTDKSASGQYNPTSSRGDVPAEFDTKGNPDKCTSGQCGGPGDIPTSYGSNANPNKCTSGQCGGPTSNIPTAYDKNRNPSKCTSGKCEAPEDIPTGYGLKGNPSDCASGQCGEPGVIPTSYDTNEYSAKCTSGQCGGPTGNLPTAYESNENPSKCTSGECRPSDNGPTSYGSNENPSKCTSGQCKEPEEVHAPYGLNGNPNNCLSGQCEHPPSNSNDIPVNIAGSSRTTTTNHGLNFQTNDKSANTAPSTPPGCISGNCGTLPAPRPTVKYPYGYNSNQKSTFPTQNQNAPICNTPNCNNDAINPYASASAGASAPSYNKPVPFLTAPKHEASCTSPHCQSSNSNIGTPIQFPPGSIVPSFHHSTPDNFRPGCRGENCKSPQFPAPESIPGILTSKYPNTEYKPTDTKCTTPDCAPSYSQSPSYKPPHNALPSITPGGEQANYNIHASSLPGSTVPSFHHNTPTNLRPGCSGENCKSPQFPAPESIPGTLTSKYPNSEYKPTEPKCTTSNCAPSYPQNPSYKPPLNSLPSYNIPLTSSLSGGPLPSSSYNAGLRPISPNNIPNYNPQGSIPSSSSYSSTLPTASDSPGPNNDGSIPSFVPLGPPKSQNCLGNSCPSFPSTSLPNYGQNSAATHPLPANLGQPSTPSVSGPNYSHNSAPIHPVGSNSILPITNYPGAQSTAANNAKADAKKPEIPYLGGFGGPSGLLKPNEFNLPSSISTANNNKPITATSSVSCSTGKCNSQGHPSPHENGGTNNADGSPNGTPSASCTTGNCGSSGLFNLNGANAAAGAAASASAVAYSGGFGGPPGLLTPFDSGKGSNAVPTFNGKIAGGIGAAGHLTGHGSPSAHNNGITGGAQASAGAQAVAVAGANAGATSGASYGHPNGGHGAGGGCGGGCSGSGSYGAGKSLDLNADIHHTKGGLGDEHGALSGANAAAKAGATSFGSSFASAHASAGAAVKGGYGRR